MWVTANIPLRAQPSRQEPAGQEIDTPDKSLVIA